VSERHNLARFDCDQPRYNILFREIESEILPLCRDEGIGVIAYNPLAGGFLTGKYQPGDQPVEGTRFTLGRAAGVYQKRYWNDACFSVVEELKDYFAPREKPLAQVAVAWVLRQPGITSAIVGASKPEQLRESLPAVNLKLEAEELQVLDEAWYKLPRMSDPNIALR
jgi:aryl-alcohol dehydrogenase-like predicted oxidoreductase